jgi:hypothetical protein
MLVAPSMVEEYIHMTCPNYGPIQIRIRVTALFACLFLLATAAKADGPPTGFRDVKWGSAPRASLKKFSGPTDDGLTLYMPVNLKNLPPLFDVPVTEEDYQFIHGKFYSGDAYLDGEANLQKMQAALIKTFGPPSLANESLRIWKWKWPKSAVEIDLYYQARFAKSTVTFTNKSI